MIHDLSSTLQALLDDPVLGTDFPELLAANVVFERPDMGFTPTAPASLDLFLFDVRENLELRSNEPIVERNGNQATVRKPPRRIDCSYLVTAWPTGAPPLELKEHQLLGQALQVLAGHPTVPAGYLQGSLAGQEPPLPMVSPQLDGLKSPADFWTAMGNQLRASFTVTVTISVPVLPDVTGPIVTTKAAGFGRVDGPVEETLWQVGGRVVDGGGHGLAGAVVDVLDAGLRATADAEGRYSFVRVPAGARTLRAVAVGFEPLTRAVTVPGPPEEFELTLNPLP